jgi:lambda family phage tail tape measure protein
VATVGELNVDLTLTDRGFTVTTTKAGSVISTFTRQLQQADAALEKHKAHHQGLLTSFRHFVVMLGAARFALMDFNDVILGLPRSIVKTSGEMERLTKLMEGLSRATGEAAKKADAAQSFGFIIDAAQRAPFEIKALTDAFVKFKSAGVDPMKGGFDGLINSVAKFGGDSQTLHRASIAIQQMAGKGVISMEELRQQLGEAVPNAMQLMADGTGYSMAQFVKHVSKGEVQAREGLARMFVQMQLQNRGAAAAMMDTWVGLVQQLETTWRLLENAAGQGFMGALKESTRELMEMLKGPEAKRFAYEVGEGLKTAVIYGTQFVKQLYEMSTLIKDLAIAAAVFFGANKLKEWAVSASGALAAPFRAQMVTMQQANAALNERIAAVARAQITEREMAVAASAEIMARKRAEYAALETQHAQHLARIANLEAISRAGRYAAGTTIDGTKVGGRYVDQAAIAGQIAASQTAARIADEQMKKNQELRAEIAKTSEEHRNQITVLGRQADSAANAGKSLGALGLAAAGLRGLLAALGGPFGVLITVLSIGIPLWMEWGNRGKEAIEKVKRALASGTADKETLDSTDARVEELKRKIEEREKILSLPATDKDYRFRNRPKMRAAFEKELAEWKEELAAATKDRNEAMKQVSDNNAKVGASAIEKEFDAAKIAIAKGFDEQRDRVKEKRNELELDTSVSPEKKKDKLTLFAKQIGEIGAKQAEAELAALQGIRSRLEAEYDKGPLSPEAQGRLNAVKRLISQQMDLVSESRKFADNQMKMEKKDRREEPLTRSLEDARIKMNEALAKLGEIEDGTVTVSEVYERVTRRVQGMLKEGRYDVADAADPKKLIRPAADDSRLILEGFYLTIAEIATKNNQIIGNANKELAKSIEDLAQSSERFWDPENAERRSSAVMKVEQSLAKMRATLIDTRAGLETQLSDPKILSKLKPEEIENIRQGIIRLTGEIETFDQKAAQITQNTGLAALMNFASDLRAKTQTLAADAIENPMERARASLQASNERLVKQFDAMKTAALAGLQPYTEEWAWAMIFVNDAHKMMLDNMAANEAAFFRQHKTAVDKMLDSWKDTATQMDNATAQWAQNGVNEVLNFVKTGKFNFSDFAASILMDILKIQIQATLVKPLSGLLPSIGGWILNGLGLGATPPAGYMSSPDGTFAKGGIMTPEGPLPLRKYAYGGVAKSPQVALFGEGSRPEAYVPLPDGRSIPVSMQGGAPNVVVNVINQTGQQVEAEQQGQPRFDGQKLILDVVLSAVSRPGNFRDGMKGALR